MKHYDVVIIGAGTSGLSARREVSKKTDNYVVVDDGPLGTTCARVGCMPSKVFIQAANDYHRRLKLNTLGISGGEGLQVDRKQLMQHVRSLRDRFTNGVLKGMQDWQQHKLIRARADITGPNTIKIDDEQVQADKIIIAAGSRPIIPKPWQAFESHLIDTNQFFELEELPEKVAVIGLGVIGIELGQALARLGVTVFAATVGKGIGGLSDPKIQNYVAEKFKKEFPIGFEGAELKRINENNRLEVEIDGTTHEVDKALIAIGRRPNLDRVGLQNLNIELNPQGLPEFDFNSMNLKAHPHIFIAGDINADRPILHEAADEGFIAGYNAVHPMQCFKRRTPLGLTFSDPNIAFAGQKYQQLVDKKIDFISGEVSFEGQGRSIVKLKEQGLLHVYAERSTGLLLGAELQAPDGEHLAHLIAWAISLKLTVFETLRMPFYHPVVEEGLRTALRQAAMKIEGVENKTELFRCQDSPIR